MKRWLAAAVAVVVLVGCGGPQRWQERGFDSEEACWELHGWDGSDYDKVNRKTYFDFWCGPIKDG